MSRLDVIIAREYQTGNGDTKTAFTKIGTVFPSKDGKGYNGTLDLPMPYSLNREGRLEMRFMLREPLPARDDAPRGNTPSRALPRDFDDLNDPPF